jgi:hypothetical protein
MNEGLAEYALVRALMLIAREGPPAWRPDAERRLAGLRSRLERLTENVTQSFRLRYYATGPAQALLLDALAGPGWKAKLAAENLTLQDALADASGLDAAMWAALRRAESTFEAGRVRADAAQGVTRLQARRAAQVDSVLSRPGIKVVLSADALSGKDFGNCGFDPQNHLQVTPDVQLQTRWWRPCAGRALISEFNVPSVHDARAGTVSAVIGSESDVKLTVDAREVALKDGDRIAGAANVKLEAPRASVESARADVERVGDTIRIRPLP